MSDKERELVEYFIKIVEETPSLHAKWINPPIKITTWKHLLEQDKEIERLNNIIKEAREYIELIETFAMVDKINIFSISKFKEILDKENKQ